MTRGNGAEFRHKIPEGFEIQKPLLSNQQHLGPELACGKSIPASPEPRLSNVLSHSSDLWHLFESHQGHILGGGPVDSKTSFRSSTFSVLKGVNLHKKGSDTFEGGVLQCLDDS